MIHLEAGQERMAFLGGFITSDMMKSRKGSVKIRILDVYPTRGIAKVEIKRTGATCNISMKGIIPFNQNKENAIKLEALAKKFNG